MWKRDRKGDSSSSDFVDVAWAENDLEAQIIHGRLEAEGIASFVSNQTGSQLGIANAGDPYGPLFGGRQIAVRPEDAEKARSVLDSIEGEQGGSVT